MKNKIEFLFMFTLVALNAYLLGGIVSGLLLIVFIMIPIIDVMFTQNTKRCIDVHITLPKEDTMRKEFIEVKVEIKNKSILPTAVIEIEIIKDDIFDFDNSDRIRFTVEAGKSKKISMKYYQLFRGKGTVGIDNIKIEDYFGISNVNIDICNNKKELTVLPMIFPIDRDSDIVRSFTDSRIIRNSDYCINFDNVEVEPGYEFRQYIPGDNLNRVNWKRFSRNQELLVRKNENIIEINKKTIIMNPYIITKKNNKKRDNMMLESRILKTVLSLAAVLLDINIDVEICVYENSSWTIKSIKDYEDLITIQNKFAEYQFIYTSNEDESKQSLEQVPVKSNVIFVTENIEATNQLNEKECELVLVKESNDSINKRNLWLLTEDYKFYNLS